METRLLLFNGDDTPFPNQNEQVEIYNFRFSADRVGSSPTITATVEYPECLDDLLSESVYCIFNDEKYHIKDFAPSSYNNTSVMYKHNLTLVSERRVLENVYFFDTVSDINDGTPVSNSTTFNFFGNVHQFAARFQASMNRSGLGTLLPTSMGYSIVVDSDVLVENKEISFDNLYLLDALKEMNNVYGVPFYFVGKVIHIGYSTPLVLPNFKYGIDNSLLSISKDAGSDRIYNKIFGYGNNVNIPFFYPNETPNGLIPVHSRGLDVNISNKYKLSRCTPTTLGSDTVWGTKLDYENIERIKEYSQANVYSITEANSHSVSTESRGYEFIATQDAFAWGKTMKCNIPENISGDLTINIKEITNCNANESTWTGFPSIKRMDFEFGVEYADGATVVKYDNSYNTNATTMAISNSTRNFTSTLTAAELVGAEKYYVKVKYYFNTWYLMYLPATIENTVTSAWIFRHTELSIAMGYNTSGWVDGDNEVSLYNYGISVVQNDMQIGDYIYFTNTGVMPYSERLIPTLYRSSLGMRHFYPAKNYPFTPEGLYVLDTELGEYSANSAVQNDKYKKDNNTYYDFENPYTNGNPKEIIKEYDISPTIKNVTNAANQRIDRFVDIAFDEGDNDEIDETTGKMIHPYFYVKLRKFNGDNGFNLFERSIEDGYITIEMTSGKCGGCSFVVGVTEGSNINPVEVYETTTVVNGVTYQAGDLKRDEYGNVRINGNQPRQQDTVNYECWIALKKDVDTFGITMPNAEGDYRPAVTDSFVFTNIDLPMPYILAAEQRLEEQLVYDLWELNSYKYNFTLGLSSIYYSENRVELNENLNESALIQFEYAGKTYKYYISNITVNVKNDSPLPTITLNLTTDFNSFNRGMAYRFGVLVDSKIPNIVRDVNYNNVANKKKNDNRNKVFVGDSLVVNDDVVISGNSVKKMIENLRTSVDENFQSQIRENAWGKIGQRSDISNRFNDGCFVNDFNSFETTNITSGVTISDKQAVGGNSICVEMGAKSTLDIVQDIEVDAGLNTISLHSMTNIPLELGEQLFLVVQFLKQNKSVVKSQNIPIDLVENFQQNFAVVDVPEYAQYIRIGFYSDFLLDRVVYINGIMCCSGEFAAKNTNGVFVKTALSPEKYIKNDNEDISFTKNELQRDYETELSKKFTDISETEEMVYLLKGDDTEILYKCNLNIVSSNTRNILLSTEYNGIETHCVFANNTGTNIYLYFVGDKLPVYMSSRQISLSANERVIVTFYKTDTEYVAKSTTLATSSITAGLYALPASSELRFTNKGDVSQVLRIESNTNWEIA